MKTQFKSTNGEVILSKWWRTQSAQAVFRRVAKDRKRKFAELRRAQQRKGVKI